MSFRKMLDRNLSKDQQSNLYAILFNISFVSMAFVLVMSLISFFVPNLIFATLVLVIIYVSTGVIAETLKQNTAIEDIS